KPLRRPLNVIRATSRPPRAIPPAADHAIVPQPCRPISRGSTSVRCSAIIIVALIWSCPFRGPSTRNGVSVRPLIGQDRDRIRTGSSKQLRDNELPAISRLCGGVRARGKRAISRTLVSGFAQFGLAGGTVGTVGKDTV